MLILPDGHYATKALPPQPREYWNPSLSLPRDQLGNPVVQQYWRLRARLHDGHIVWCGRFDDRDDADAFLFALATGSLQQQPELWRLPMPWWHPDLGELLEYDFSTLRFLSGASGANQTDTVPIDWNSSNNSIEVISHAGNADNTGTNFLGGGGGGGGYAKSLNVPLTAGGSATYHLDGAGAGTAVAQATFYGGATLAASGVGICGAANGAGGTPGGAGASITNAIGSTKFAGGNGGNALIAPCCGPQAGGGGGGAAGPHGAGGAGVTPNNSTEGAGGTGDNGNTAAGANGTQFDGSHGSGGGGVGGGGDTSGVPGNGGNYGGAGGGGSLSLATSRAGLIVLTYTPGAPFIIGYIPMLFIS